MEGPRLPPAREWYRPNGADVVDSYLARYFTGEPADRHSVGSTKRQHVAIPGDNGVGPDH